MKELLTIKNYIYGKGILSKLYENPFCLIGTHKGKAFKIYFKKTKTEYKSKKKSIPQLALEIAGKTLTVKHHRNIPSMIN